MIPNIAIALIYKLVNPKTNFLLIRFILDHLHLDLYIYKIIFYTISISVQILFLNPRREKTH